MMLTPLGNWYEIKWVEYKHNGSLFLVDHTGKTARHATIFSRSLDSSLGLVIGDAVYVIQSQVVDIDGSLFCRAESIICEDRS